MKNLLYLLLLLVSFTSFSQQKAIEITKKIVFATGLATLGASAVSAASGSESSSLLFVIGSGITIGSGIMESTIANNSNYKWDFKIIEK